MPRMRWCARFGQLGATASLMLAILGAAVAAPGDEGLAKVLRQQHAELAPAMARSDFGRPLVLQSRETDRSAEGVVHAVLDATMARTMALAQPERWCDVLMLHQNTRSCQVHGDHEIHLVLAGRRGLMRDGTALTLRFDSLTQILTDGSPVLDVRLHAERGPLGTRDFDIRAQAMALPGGRSFLRLRYSYGFGLAARLAMGAYLGTWGQEKVGFSRETGPGEHSVSLVRGMRGVIERKAMRYFLAMDAVLQTLDLPTSQVEQRLMRWFDATEQYARQLHELERQDYLALKREQLGLPTP